MSPQGCTQYLCFAFVFFFLFKHTFHHILMFVAFHFFYFFVYIFFSVAAFSLNVISSLMPRVNVSHHLDSFIQISLGSFKVFFVFFLLLENVDNVPVNKSRAFHFLDKHVRR